MTYQDYYNAGLIDGQEAGLAPANTTYDEFLRTGLSSDYVDGYNAGFIAGWNIARPSAPTVEYDNGYNAGFAIGEPDGQLGTYQPGQAPAGMTTDYTSGFNVGYDMGYDAGFATRTA